MPDIAILSPDGTIRHTVIVADSVAAAQALFPGMLCVPRGTGADKTAVDPAQPLTPPYTPETQAVEKAVMAVAKALNWNTTLLNAALDEIKKP